MLSVLDLPPEILAQIVRFANLNGDFSSLRLSNSRLFEVISSQTRLLLDDLCFVYGISPKVSHLYLSQKAGGPLSYDKLHPSIVHVMSFGSFLHRAVILGADADRAMGHPLQTAGPCSQLSNREPFMLFAVFSQALNSCLTISHSTASDLLAPSPDGGQSFSKRVSEKFVHFLKQELTLEELEATIGAISICAMRLWSTVFMFRPRDSTVSGFGSRSGASFNNDQAILTEHIIWKGPLWVSRILRRYGSTEIGAVHETEANPSADDSLLKEGVWRGSREEGARLAANGVARLLWRERQQKIEAKANASAEKITINDMRANPSVWRGSSGDL